MTQTVTVDARDIRVDGRVVRVGRVVGERYRFLEDPVATVEALRRVPSSIDLFTFVPSVAEASRQYPYEWEPDNFAALRVTTYDAWWTTQITRKTRNMVRLAEKKGVTCRELPFSEELVRGIKGVYDETRVRQGKRNVHYGKTLEAIHEAHRTFLDSSAFIGAFAGGQLIGFVKLTWDERRLQAGMMNIVAMVGQRDKAPSNALIAAAVRYCADNALPVLVYARYTYGRKSGDSLVDFKKHNGFAQCDVPRYYVPLTMLGRIAYTCRLHREVGAFVPESVLGKARQLRRWWYTGGPSETGGA